MQCDCCKEQVQQVDDLGLCFTCSIVQHFAAVIEERTELSSEEAVDLASDLATLVQSRILERCKDAPKDAWAGFFDDVGVGMIRTSAEH